MRGLYAHSAFEAAAAAAFWFFLSLVPLLALAGFLVGQVARTRGVDALVGPLLDVIPATAEEIVRVEVERLAGARASSLAPLGVIGYLWTASSGLHHLMDVFEAAAQAKPRAWWKQRGIALSWVVVGLATICVLALLLVQIDAGLRGYAHHLPIHARDLGAQRHSAHRGPYARHENVIAAILTLVVGMALLGGFYRFSVEHPARVRRRVWPGTVVAVASWLVVSWVFGEYVVSIADYALYYGGLAAVAVLLVWLYLTTLSLVVGAEVNAHLEGAKARGRPPPRAATS